MRFEKPCKRCGELFRPIGKYCNFCDKCKKNKGRNIIDRDSEIIRHRNRIRATKHTEAPTIKEKEKKV